MLNVELYEKCSLKEALVLVPIIFSRDAFVLALSTMCCLISDWKEKGIRLFTYEGKREGKGI